MTAVIVVPFIINHNLQSRKKRKFLLSLEGIAEKNGSKITRHDLLKDTFAIGMDENHRKVFYVKRAKGVEEASYVDLKDLTSCTVSTDGSSVSTGSGKGYSASSVKLVFTSSNQENSVKPFIFFDGSDPMSILDEELPLAEKWASLINSKLASARR